MEEEMNAVKRWAHNHPHRNISKLILTVADEPLKRDIVLLIEEAATSDDVSLNFDFPLQSYIKLYSHLNRNLEIDFNDTGYLIQHSGQVYGRRVDYINSLMSNLSQIMLGKADDFVVESVDRNGNNDKSRKTFKKILKITQDPFVTQLASKKFKSTNFTKRFEIVAPRKPSSTASMFHRQNYLHPNSWVVSRMPDIENVDVESKKNFKLLTYIIEPNLNEMKSDMSFLQMKAICENGDLTALKDSSQFLKEFASLESRLLHNTPSLNMKGPIIDLTMDKLHDDSGYNSIYSVNETEINSPNESFQTQFESILDMGDIKSEFDSTTPLVDLTTEHDTMQHITSQETLPENDGLLIDLTVDEDDVSIATGKTGLISEINVADGIEEKSQYFIEKMRVTASKDFFISKNVFKLPVTKLNRRMAFELPTEYDNYKQARQMKLSKLKPTNKNAHKAEATREKKRQFYDNASLANEEEFEGFEDSFEGYDEENYSSYKQFVAAKRVCLLIPSKNNILVEDTIKCKTDTTASTFSKHNKDNSSNNVTQENLKPVLSLTDIHVPANLSINDDNRITKVCFKENEIQVENANFYGIKASELHKKIGDQSSMSPIAEKWHDKLRPILAESCKRHHFNIYDIGSQILNTFLEAPSAPISFAKIMSGKDPTFCSRYFLSMLLLANQGNVDLFSKASEKHPTAWTDVQCKLLTSIRQSVNVEDNIGQFLERKKLRKDSSIRVSKVSDHSQKRDALLGSGRKDVNQCHRNRVSSNDADPYYETYPDPPNKKLWTNITTRGRNMENIDYHTSLFSHSKRISQNCFPTNNKNLPKQLSRTEIRKSDDRDSGVSSLEDSA